MAGPFASAMAGVVTVIVAGGPAFVYDHLSAAGLRKSRKEQAHDNRGLRRGCFEVPLLC
jgi:hypothetical protein